MTDVKYISGHPICDVTARAALAEKADADDVTSLGARVTALESGADGGLTADIKSALLACFRNVAWINDDGQDYYDALDAALNPPANLSSITAVYTQSGTVYDTSSLDDLRPDLVVTAHWSDNTTSTVTTYTLSGTLTEGTSTITVAYGGKTTIFNVTVVSRSVYLTLDDIIESTGITGLSVSNSGTVSETGIETFSILEINKSILPAKMALRNNSGGAGPNNIVFARNTDGTYYGSDGAGKIFKFIKSGSKYTAQQVSGVTERIVTDSFTDGQTFIAELTNGILTVTSSTGSISFTNANTFGVWLSSSNTANPTDCEVLYNGTL